MRSSSPARGRAAPGMTCGLLVGERNGIDVAAVVRLATMRRAAVAVKPRIRIGAQREILDAVDAATVEPRRDVAGEIEHGVTLARRGDKEPLVVEIGGAETGDELRSDFIARLADHRPDGGRNPRALRAEPLHGGDRRLDDAGQGTAPAGV